MFLYPRYQNLGGVENRLDVHIEAQIEVSVLHIFRRLVAVCRARIVHNDVDVPMGPEHCVRQILPVLLFRYVYELKGAVQFMCSVLASLFAVICDDYAGALAREFCCNCFAKTLT